MKKALGLVITTVVIVLLGGAAIAGAMAASGSGRVTTARTGLGRVVGCGRPYAVPLREGHEDA